MVHVYVSSEVNLNLNVSFLTLLRYLYANNFYMVVFMNRSPFGAGLNLVINQPLWQSYYQKRNSVEIEAYLKPSWVLASTNMNWINPLEMVANVRDRPSLSR